VFDFELNDGADRILVVFSGQLEGNDTDYGNEIDLTLKKRNYPYKELVFLFPRYIETEIKRLINNGDRILSNANRATKADQISFVSFNGYADLNLFYKTEEEKGSIADNPDKLKWRIIRLGLLSLVEKRTDQVILKSPPGTIFEKPSNQKFHEFMKASELSTGFSESQFVAFSLLAHRPKRDNNNLIQNIWIDTFSISTFIEALIYYIKRFNNHTHRQVKYHSFQSYGNNDTAGYKTSIPDAKDDVWVIISASRSNNMGRDIFKIWSGIKHDQIVTLLSYSDTEYDQKYLSQTCKDNPQYPIKPGDQIVVNISRFSEHHTTEKRFGSEVSVKIIGENFTAQVEEPNQVLLRKVHSTLEIESFIEPINEGKNLLVHINKSNRLRSVFFDFSTFKNEKSELKTGYLRWLKDVVEWYIPPAVGYVIYDPCDDASKLLYGDLIKHLTNQKVINIDINKINDIEKETPIIALMPVITRGHAFIKLNSDLRLLEHNAQRIFISPFATPHTKKDFSLFEQSLVMGPRNLKYQFLNYKKIYIGHQERRNSWERELDLVEQFESPVWLRRTKALQDQAIGIINTIGVSCNLQDEKLKFNIDFAFWKPGYNPDLVNPTAVYLTISSILQNLREKPYTLIDKESLFTHVYQHSVLNPLNFSRFNDPLLQSSLWRCAYDGELDYRTPSELSRKFVVILTRLALSRRDGEHNATLDLLVGIAIGKIKLSKEYLSSMTASLTELLKKYPEYIELLNYISNNFQIDVSNQPESRNVI